MVTAASVAVAGCGVGGATGMAPSSAPPASATATVPVAPPPASSAPAPAQTAAPAYLIGAGDIARCDSNGDGGTAALLAGNPGTVFTLGDNVYPDGTAGQFADCYGPTWGRMKARTRPVIGNHEYHSAGAAPYFRYFGAAAGPAGRGYYSYAEGAWHVVVLNTNCAQVPGGCGAGSAQARWLRGELAANRRACTVAMMHHPLFTSSDVHPPSTEVRPLVHALYDAGADVMLAGHNHVYERFAPQTPTGGLDRVRGIRQFVVGTGGAPLYRFGAPRPHSEVRDNQHLGVLRLSLEATSYRWAFLRVDGTVADTGTARCH